MPAADPNLSSGAQARDPADGSVARDPAAPDSAQLPPQDGDTTQLVEDLGRFFADAAGRSSVGGALPDGAIVRFVIHEAGAWTLIRVGPRVEIATPPHPAPDCEMTCSKPDFHALLRGELDPREGYLAGRLVLAGDVGIVLELRRALRAPRRAAGG